jgi:hypothetical protein
MTTDERLENLENDIRLITDKLKNTADFENMLIEQLDNFKEKSKAINKEAMRLAQLVDMQINNNRQSEQNVSDIIDSRLASLTSKEIVKLIIEQLKQRFYIE